jgi:hypothetical protein
MQDKLSSLSQYGIEITVNNPQIRHTTFRQHVLYTVSGTDSLGGFQVQRRYKEFLALRKVLLIEWPGCCIISLPPKQALVTFTQGNLEANFIENRRKLLEYFLKNLTKNSYILISEEFQFFLRGPVNFHNSNIANKPANYVQIGQKYSKVFENYWNFKTSPEAEKDILTSADFFNQGKAIIEKLEKAAEECFMIFKGFEKKSAEIVSDIQELTKMYEKLELYLNPQDPHEDPYVEIRTWCRNNLLEVKGICECVHRRAEIEKVKKSLIGKIEDEKKSIQKRQAGKKKLVQYLNKKSNEYYISQSEANIQQFEACIAAIDIIINISAAIFLQEEVPSFKQKKTNTLHIVMEIFEEIGDKEIGKFIQEFEEIHQKI